MFGRAPCRYRLRVPPAPGGERRTRVAMLGDMGRGTVDDSKTWHQYGAPAMNVSLALGQEVARGELDAVFLFGDLSYAQGCASKSDRLETAYCFNVRWPSGQGGGSLCRRA